MDRNKNKNLKRVGFTVMMAALGGLVGFLGAQAGMKSATSTPPAVMITLAILFVPCFLLVIAAHEAGHALAGIWVKFDFRLYVVGPFLWEKDSAGWNFRWNRNLNTSGGLVICLPTGRDRIRERFAVYAAGGPVTSLLVAGVLFLCYHLLSYPNPSLLLVQCLRSLSLMISLLSFLIFALTAFPIHMNGLSSDGARVLRLFRGGDVAQFEVLLIKIISSSYSGIRPSQWDISEIQEAQKVGTRIKAPMLVYLHYFLYQYEWDQGQLDKAEYHLTNYIAEQDDIPAGFRLTVPLEAAFFYACAKEDLDKALAFWVAFKPSAIIPRSSVLATEAAISLLKKDQETARIQIDKAQAEIPNMMDRGIAKVLTERLAEMKLKATAQ